MDPGLLDIRVDGEGRARQVLRQLVGVGARHLVGRDRVRHARADRGVKVGEPQRRLQPGVADGRVVADRDRLLVDEGQGVAAADRRLPVAARVPGEADRGAEVIEVLFVEVTLDESTVPFGSSRVSRTLRPPVTGSSARSSSSRSGLKYSHLRPRRSVRLGRKRQLS